MKKSIVIPTLILAILIFSYSCEWFPDTPGQAKQIVLSKKSAEIIEADLEFAFDIFKEIYALAEEENLMISPLSISYALGMTYNGAGGSTLDAFIDVLHFDSLSKQDVNESYKDLMSQLITLDDKVELSIANGIWYREGEVVNDSFIQANQDYFDAAVEEINFHDPNTLDHINGWIEDKTNDKIVDMLDYIPVDAYMYLINAIYFNATWKYEFDKSETREREFSLADNSKINTDFMRAKGNYPYAVTEDYEAVELPYGDSSFSMVLLLPLNDDSLDDLVEKLDKESWEKFSQLASPMEVTIDLPKFKYGYKSLLNEPLITLGLEPAFDQHLADFTNMTTTTKPWISRVIHQTYIDVMEKGTEAAAVTIVEMVDLAMPMELHFDANRPFLYIIKENSTGAIIFMGKVGKPEYN